MNMKSNKARIFAAALAFALAFTACPEPDNPSGGLPALGGTVSVSGTAQVGQLLTANIDLLGGSGTVAYQWKRGGTVNIGTDSGTYTVQSADIGLTITVSVTRSDNSGSVSSPPTAAVTDPNLPALGGTVSISGTTQVGQLLTANIDLLGGSGTVAYQWKRGGTVIGANSGTYTLQSADLGASITVTNILSLSYIFILPQLKTYVNTFLTNL